MRGHTTWKTGAREYQDMWRMRGHKTMKRNRAEAVATARVLGTAVEWEGVWYGTHWKTQKHHIRQLVPPHCHITYTKWEGVWYTFKHTIYDSWLLLTHVTQIQREWVWYTFKHTIYDSWLLLTRITQIQREWVWYTFKHTIYDRWLLLTVILHIQSERECDTRSNTPYTTTGSSSLSYYIYKVRGSVVHVQTHQIRQLPPTHRHIHIHKGPWCDAEGRGPSCAHKHQLYS